MYMQPWKFMYSSAVIDIYGSIKYGLSTKKDQMQFQGSESPAYAAYVGTEWRNEDDTHICMNTSTLEGYQFNYSNPYFQGYLGGS